MLFYTWKDIERYCLKRKKEWLAGIEIMDFYPDEILVYIKKNIYEQKVYDFFNEFFPRNYNYIDKTIKLDKCERVLQISIENEYELWQEKTLPLFEKAIYMDSVYPNTYLKDLECPVISFHSYKGGVGRTLSLLAFAQAWTNVHANSNKNKLLIVDSDLEAPGLTWIQGAYNEDNFSYLDLLTLIQDVNDTDIDQIVELASNEIGKLSIPIETEEQKIEHLFLPTFRYDEQLFDLYASPNSVIMGKNREYILAEILSKIAAKLGVAAVLVDLRAGISEYSAPLIFDPRVKKYFVTSTSYQSVTGTKKLLEYVSKGLKITEDSNLPTILLSMVPNTLGNYEKQGIIEELVSCFNADERNERLLDNMVVELPFASELVHLTKLQQIFANLKNRDMLMIIEKIVTQNYGNSEDTENEYTEKQRRILLKKIHDFADKQITAEANGAVKLLLTEPIKNLCLKYSDQIPVAIVNGAKGSGKTFLYRQMIEQQDWNTFRGSISDKQIQNRGGYFIPVFATQNGTELSEILNSCIDTVNTKMPFAQISKSIYIDNAVKLERQSRKETEWIEFWEKLLVKSVNQTFETFEQLNEKLQNQKIVFVIDGLEEILQNVFSSEIQKSAIQVLCQKIVNILVAKYQNIGLIIFLRSDMARNAIVVNYEQFKQAHSYAELKWSSDEALKLAVWIVAQAIDDFYRSPIPVENATKDVIDKYLEKLWGLKLGKKSSNEAYSSRWILAALSDFNGQLQARDIIRFLKYAAQPTEKKAPYNDRILMPVEIRNAVSRCSKEKIDEIKMEYKMLNPIFSKLEELPVEKKKLPLNLGDDSLNAMEEKIMIQEGYLTRDGEKLYLPEIVRHALGFSYEKGARPKVLSLLLKH